MTEEKAEEWVKEYLRSYEWPVAPGKLIAFTQVIAEKVEAEDEHIQELESLFALQETHMKKAIKMWQEAMGKHEVLPDLGKLLDWLVGVIESHEEVYTKSWKDGVESMYNSSVKEVRRRCLAISRKGLERVAKKLLKEE